MTLKAAYLTLQEYWVQLAEVGGDLDLDLLARLVEDQDLD